MLVSCKDTGTNITVSFDGHVVWQGDPGQSKKHQISHVFDDVDGEQHVLSIALSDKLPCHTKIDEQGNIESDLLVDISQFSLDSVNIDQLVWDTSRYYHNFNGTQSSTIERFYGSMGCNGRVEFQFTSPVYIWLLENT